MSTPASSRRLARKRPAAGWPGQVNVLSAGSPQMFGRLPSRLNGWNVSVSYASTQNGGITSSLKFSY